MMRCISCSFRPGIIGPIMIPIRTPARLSSLMTFSFCRAVVVRGSITRRRSSLKEVIDTMAETIFFFAISCNTSLSFSIQEFLVRMPTGWLNSLHTSSNPLVSRYTCSAGW